MCETEAWRTIPYKAAHRFIAIVPQLLTSQDAPLPDLTKPIFGDMPDMNAKMPHSREMHGGSQS